MDATLIAERREVWIALSDLFLDTDVRLSYAYIARVLAASKYSLEELEVICRDEVAPAVESNLLDIAGDWAGFPEEWLIAQITARPPGRHRMRTNALDEFHAVAHLVRALRRLPPEKREERTQLWQKMRLLFLERNPARPDVELSDYVFREELLPSYGASVELYRRHDPKHYPTLAEIEATARSWQPQ